MIALIFIHLPWLVIGTMLTTILVCSQQELLKGIFIAKRDGTECPPEAIAHFVNIIKFLVEHGRNNYPVEKV